MDENIFIYNALEAENTPKNKSNMNTAILSFVFASALVARNRKLV